MRRRGQCSSAHNGSSRLRFRSRGPDPPGRNNLPCGRYGSALSTGPARAGDAGLGRGTSRTSRGHDARLGLDEHRGEASHSHKNPLGPSGVRLTATAAGQSPHGAGSAAGVLSTVAVLAALGLDLLVPTTLAVGVLLTVTVLAALGLDPLMLATLAVGVRLTVVVLAAPLGLDPLMLTTLAVGVHLTVATVAGVSLGAMASPLVVVGGITPNTASVMVNALRRGLDRCRWHEKHQCNCR
jgi:hypothetical protein